MSATANAAEGTFAYDSAFLSKYDDGLIILTNSTNGTGDGGASRGSSVIVSPKYQGKVFTSTAHGAEGKSLGWVNYKAFTAAALDEHMNAYGGENRLWLGPEGSRYSLFFPSTAKEMVFEHWKTPAAFDTEPWELVASSAADGGSPSPSPSSSVCTMRKEMMLVNHAGARMDIVIDRRVRILDTTAPTAADSDSGSVDADDASKILLTAALAVDGASSSSAAIADRLAAALGDSSIASVGYETRNAMTNIGTIAWSLSSSGAPCMWVLDMFPPSDTTTIVIPYKKEGGGAAVVDNSAVATTDYFGQISEDRIKFVDGSSNTNSTAAAGDTILGTLYFKADGKSRGKLGVKPGHTMPVAGSYDAENKSLTIVVFSDGPKGNNKFDADAGGAAPVAPLYLNQEWSTTKDPYSGDAMNAYNDGPITATDPTDGSVTTTQMGPFYEIESVSPAAFLAVGETQVHYHSVFHFVANKGSGSDCAAADSIAALDTIAQLTLGVSLDAIEKAFA